MRNKPARSQRRHARPSGLGPASPRSSTSAGSTSRLIHPHPRASADATARGDAFLEKLRAYCETLDGRRIEREDRVPDEYITGFAELGVFGMKIPLEYGGLGLSMAYYGQGADAGRLGAPEHRHARSRPTSRSAYPSPSRCSAPKEQKEAFLPRCAKGAVSAFLLTEFDVGSDPARLGTTATPTDDGEAYLLDGVKLWTTNGVIAELLVVMAAVPKGDGRRGGITAFVVEADSPGITVENRNAVHGPQGHRKRGHAVPPGAGARGQPARQGGRGSQDRPDDAQHRPPLDPRHVRGRRQVVPQDRTRVVRTNASSGARGSASMRRSPASSRSWQRRRSDSKLWSTCPSQLADAGTKDIRIEAALAKLWASEMACRIADELVQIRGGRGFETADSLAARGERAVPAEQLVRDLRINRIFEGSSEIMRLLIAREAVDAHLKAAGDLANLDADVVRQGQGRPSKASGFYAKWLPQLVVGKGVVPTSYDEFGQLAKHLRYVERSSRKLARQTFYGMSRWQAKLEYRQAFLGRIVDIGAELFAMAAACSRAEMLRATSPRRGRREPTSSPTSSAHRPGCGSRRCSTAFGRTPTRATARSPRLLAGELRLARGRRDRPVRGHRAVDRRVGARCSRRGRMSHRRYR